jgi:hypothetical protein
VISRCCRVCAGSGAVKGSACSVMLATVADNQFVVN